MPEIALGNIKIEVELKDIKNIHLSVHPPDGLVTIAAPEKMDIDTIRVFALNKLKWIKKQQSAFKNQDRETRREFLSQESHYFQGERYLLQVIEIDSKPIVEINQSNLIMYIRPNTSTLKRKEIMDDWYRQELKSLVPDILHKWETKIGVKANDFGVKLMRTKWGSCNIEAKRIWLNLELAKKPIDCLEYIVVHELVHLLERNHNDKFIRHMNEFMPKWRFHRDELNRLPFRHTDWKY